jgi:DNA invertase Pin-like site-specific DNA recombinase
VLEVSGRLHGRQPKLTPRQVQEARELRRAGVTIPGVARIFGIAESTLRRHLSEQCKHHQLEARRA